MIFHMIFHILMTTSSSFHGFITNQFNDLLPVGLLAQLVEHCTGITEVKGSNPLQAWIFSGFLFATAKNCVYNCDDHLSVKLKLTRLKTATAVYLAPVAQKKDTVIHRLNFYLLDSAIGFPNTDLSNGQWFIWLQLFKSWIALSNG